MTELFLLIFSVENNEKETRLVFVIMLIMAFGATTSSFFIREDLRRLTSVADISMMSSSENTMILKTSQEKSRAE